MKNIFEILQSLTYSEIKTIFEKHLLWAGANHRMSGEPKWFDAPGTLNVIGIRCNSESDFNFGKYNDYLLLIFNKEDDNFERSILVVTVDPNRNKNGIAHLRQGVWNSYVVGVHHFDAKRVFPKIGEQLRWALRQDKDEVEIVRTDSKGNVTGSERGYPKTNIHDNGGFADSSLGCTVIKSDEAYVDNFLPYLVNVDKGTMACKNHKDLTYCLINYSRLEKYVDELPERVEAASAIEPSDLGFQTTGEAKGATSLA